MCLPYYFLTLLFKVLPPCQGNCTQIGYSFSYGTTPRSVVPPQAASPQQRAHSHSHGSFDTDRCEENVQPDDGPGRDDPLAATRPAPEPASSAALSAGAIIPPTSSSYSAESSQTEYQALFRYIGVVMSYRSNVMS